MSSPSPLLNVSVAVPVDGGVKNMQSKPPAQWYVLKTLPLYFIHAQCPSIFHFKTSSNVLQICKTLFRIDYFI